MFRSIKVKFGLFVTSLTVLTVVIISSVILIQERTVLINEVTQRGAVLVQNLAYMSAPEIVRNESHKLLRLLKNAKDTRGVVLAFFVDNGETILAHTDQLDEKKVSQFQDHKLHQESAEKRKIPWRALHEVIGETGPGERPAKGDGGGKARGEAARTKIREVTEGSRQLIEFKEPIIPVGSTDVIGMLYLSISRKDTIDVVVNQALMQVVVIAAGFLAFGILASLLLATRLVKPIHLVSDGAKRIGRGDLDYKIKVAGKDEIGMLAKTFNEMTEKLKIAQQELLEKERLKHELQIAQRIQQSLLPKEAPFVPGFAMAHYYQATTEVGGDYYDFFPVGEKNLGVAIADVSGKGVPAALLMAVTKSTLRAQAQSSLSPGAVLSRTNAVLHQEMQRGMFVTMFYGIMEPKERTFVCACAGHNPALLVRAAEPQWIRPAGMPLGHDAGPRFNERITEATLTFQPGDVMVVYSDGVTEATNVWGEEFGEQRLAQVVIKNAHEEAGVILQRLKDELFGFMGGQAQADDVSIVVIACTGATA